MTAQTGKGQHVNEWRSRPVHVNTIRALEREAFETARLADAICQDALALKRKIHAEGKGQPQGYQCRECSIASETILENVEHHARTGHSDLRVTFAPGPWHLEDEPFYRIAVWLGEVGVAESIDLPLTSRGRDFWRANARLIAAAPTLLEALREVVAEWDTRADALPMGYMQRDTGGIELARVAIRLAEGEE